MKNKSRKINSEEIANLAGVSRSTVSRVINNYPNVPPATREKVIKIIQQYNYYPNVFAQSLAGTKVKTIGLFIVENETVSINYYYNTFITTVIEQASSSGYHVLTYIIKDTRNVQDVNSIKEVFFQRRIDGGIFIGANNHEPVIEELIAEGFVVGVIDQNLKGRTEPNRIICNVDNKTGAEKVVDYLVGLNHTKIGMILGSLRSYSGEARYQGIVNGLKKHGLTIPESWILLANFREKISYQVMTEMLNKTSDLPTAIIGGNDNIAIGAIRAIHDFGLKVPDDISVIGFDDLITSAYYTPALTTVRVDFALMGRKLVLKIIEIIEQVEENTEHFKMTTDTKIIERASCKRVIDV